MVKLLELRVGDAVHEVIDVSGSLESDARSKDALLVVTEITQANDEFFSSTIIFVNVRWNQLAWYAIAKLMGSARMGSNPTVFFLSNKKCPRTTFVRTNAPQESRVGKWKSWTKRNPDRE